MNPWQKAVRDFHLALDQPAPDTVDVSQVRRKLRADLIREEAEEVIEALGYCVDVETRLLLEDRPPHWPEVIDGLCDLLVVTLGTAVELGVDLEPFFAEVHRTNMAKVGGPVRGDGKILKPEGWEPPRIAEMWKHAKRSGDLLAQNPPDIVGELRVEGRTAARIVDALLDDLSERAGFDLDVDDDVQERWREDWIALVLGRL